MLLTNKRMQYLVTLASLAITISLEGMTAQQESGEKRQKIAHDQIALLTSDRHIFPLDRAAASLSPFLASEIEKSKSLKIKVPIDKETLNHISVALLYATTISHLPSWQKMCESALPFASSLLDKLDEQSLLKLLNAAKILDLAFLCSIINKYINTALRTRVTLISSDNVEFNLPKCAATLSLTIRNFLKDQDHSTVSLAQIASAELSIIVMALNMITVYPEYQDDTITIAGGDAQNAIGKLFTNLPVPVMVRLLKAVKYLDINCLFLDLINLFVAKLSSPFADLDRIADLLQELDYEPVLPNDLKNLIIEGLIKRYDSVYDHLRIELGRHTARISCVAFSPDNKYALSGSSNGEICYWDLKAGQARALVGHEGEVNGIVFSADGKRALTTSEGKIIGRLWDLEKGEIIKVLMGPGCADAVALSADGNFALTGMAPDRSVVLWDLRSAEKELRPNKILKCLMSDVLSVAFSPNSDKAYTMSLYTNILSWDLTREGAELNVHTALETDIFEVRAAPAVISKDGKYALTQFKDQTLRLWDLQARQVISAHVCDQMLPSWPLTAFSINSNAKHALIPVREKARLYDLAESKTIKILRHDDWVWAADISSDGKLALTGSDKKVYLWDLSTLTLPQLVYIILLFDNNMQNQLFKHAYFKKVYETLSDETKKALQNKSKKSILGLV